ncbi:MULTISPECIES: hypothetical protein [Rhodococcus]|uniref:hypothetical protein n=1 Tax=Rhodococcus TaxID=1827 RepID=UPI001E5658B9|nr:MULTISPECIES: hypothetical protein [Rhodococcus]
MRSRKQRRTRSAARQSPSPSATIWPESPGHSYSSAAGCICAHHADEILVYVGNGKNSYWATVAHIDVQDGVLTVDGETRYSRFGSERMPGLDSSGTWVRSPKGGPTGRSKKRNGGLGLDRYAGTCPK